MAEGLTGPSGPDGGVVTTPEDKEAVERYVQGPAAKGFDLDSTVAFKPDFGDAEKQLDERECRQRLEEQLVFLSPSVGDSIGAIRAKGEMAQRIRVILEAYGAMTDPDERQTFNDFARDMANAGSDLVQVTRGVVLPANLNTLLVTNPNASKKAVLHLPETEEFFVTASSEHEARMQANGGDVLYMSQRGGVEERSMGRFLKASEVRQPKELLASDYKAIVDLRNWVATVQERGLPTSKNQAEWTGEDYRLQSKLDKIQECEAYFAQTYGGDIAHYTDPTPVELNAFHRYLDKFRDSVLRGDDADATELIAVVPGDALDQLHEPTAVMPVFDRTEVMPALEAFDSGKRFRPAESIAKRLGLVAAKTAKLVGLGAKFAREAATEAISTGVAAFEAERQRREADAPIAIAEIERNEARGIELPLDPDLVEMFRTGEVFGQPLSAQEMFAQLVCDIAEGSSLGLNDLSGPEVYPVIVEELEWRRDLLTTGGDASAAEEMQFVLNALKDQYRAGGLGFNTLLELAA